MGPGRDVTHNGSVAINPLADAFEGEVAGGTEVMRRADGGVCAVRRVSAD